MATDPSVVEQAVSRTLRDSLERIQRSSDELHQAINDLVSACASSRPTNALPPMIRAHSSAASLSAALEVLSRFVTSSMQASLRSPLEEEISRATSLIAAELATAGVQPEAAPTHQIKQSPSKAAEPVEELPKGQEMLPAEDIPAISYAAPVFEAPPIAEIPLPPAAEPVFQSEVAYAPVSVLVHEPAPEAASVLTPEVHRESESASAEPIFDLGSLGPEEQELHRRAYRIAKVSMQDIKMLRPEDVRLGCENKDLCFRLRDDIEKAHREYDRRFQSIQSHPVDYFYDWMVEILASGDPQALGAYPYPSPVLHR